MNAVAKTGKPTANDRQVGGDHYQIGGTQHWDMFGPESLIYAATKYVARWRKKNGVQDLEKALHYSEKLLEVVCRCGGGGAPTLPVNRDAVAVWGPNQGIDWPEITIIQDLMFYEHASDVRRAIAGIKYLIQQATRQVAVGGPVTVQVEGVVAQRRVPRHMDTTVLPQSVPDTPSCGDGLFDVHQQRRAERVADGGSQHSSVWPWSILCDRYGIEFPRGGERRPLLDKFYTQRGPSMLLDPFVDGAALPRELKACYTLVTDTVDRPSYWLLDIARVPADLRDCYPRLSLEVNAKELEELPHWQQGLYSRGEGEDGKYRLLDRALAWGPEL